ncbi:putative methyltransferase [Colletotrichum orbiculare MAFF 240422]|uniref:Methyltransferase n=1 Tax=Colletotrichum orbiculare (strain 104-T / ATCC 96160 / CBS 514.97 / LARS 414 / MAFF 240422) TaxID=1213857 RepID=A0A484FMX3_COLOR|nr:putative methyltransferase [Colletotrichum orbiculare MAFF 240422]
MTTSVEAQTTSLANLNRDFWDANADVFYDREWLKTFAEQLHRFLGTQAPNLGLRPRDPADPVRLLDYACAYGGASWALAPFVDQILGIDIAPAIVARFNTCAARKGFDHSQAHAITGDLIADPSLAERASFDVVIISLALHHLDDPPAMLNRLAVCLKPGGVLIAVEAEDCDAQTGERVAPNPLGSHRDKHGAPEPEVLKTTNHQVFNEEIFRAWFEDAGCDMGKFLYIVNGEISHIPEEASNKPGGLYRKMVIASAVKK